MSAGSHLERGNVGKRYRGFLKGWRRIVSTGVVSSKDEKVEGDINDSVVCCIFNDLSNR